MFRRSGMKIYDKGHFQTPLRFAGVFTVEGSKLDALLRTLEPPSHNAWESERGENPAQAKRLLKDLNGWISDRVRQLMSAENLAEVDAEGISQYLPDELEDANKGTSVPQESLDEEPANVVNMSIRTAPDTAPVNELGGSTEEGNEADEGGPTDTDLTDEGGGTGEGAGATGVSGDNGSGDGGNDRGKRVVLTNVRIYCSDPNAGKYRLLFKPETADALHLRVYVIGEVGAEPAPITQYSVNGASKIEQNSNKGLIGPLSLPQGKRAVIDVVLKDALRCALGVTAHAG